MSSNNGSEILALESNNYYQTGENLLPHGSRMETLMSLRTETDAANISGTPGCLGVVQNIHSTALLQIDGKNVAMVMQHLENVLFQLAVPDNNLRQEAAAAELSQQTQSWNSNSTQLNSNLETTVEADYQMRWYSYGKNYQNLSKVLDEEAMTVLLNAMNYAYHGPHAMTDGPDAVLPRSPLQFWTKVDHEFLKATVRLCPDFAHSIPWYLYALNPDYSEEKCRELINLAEETRIQFQQEADDAKLKNSSPWSSNPRKRVSQHEIGGSPMLTGSQIYSSSESGEDVSDLNDFYIPRREKRLKSLGENESPEIDEKLISFCEHLQDKSMGPFPNVGMIQNSEKDHIEIDMLEESSSSDMMLNDPQSYGSHFQQTQSTPILEVQQQQLTQSKDTNAYLNPSVNSYNPSFIAPTSYIHADLSDPVWSNNESHVQDIKSSLDCAILEISTKTHDFKLQQDNLTKTHDFQLQQDSSVKTHDFPLQDITEPSGFETTHKSNRQALEDLETMFQETLELSSSASRSAKPISAPRTSPISLKRRSPMKSDSRPRSRNSCFAPTNPMSMSPPARIKSYNPIQKKYEYECVFCKGNDQAETVYKTHPIRINEVVICPFLRKHVCGICGATGNNAHTIKYCPFNDRGYFATRHNSHSLSSGSTWQSSMSSSSSSQSMYDPEDYEHGSRVYNNSGSSTGNNFTHSPKQPVVRKLNFDIPATTSKSNSIFFKNLQQLQNDSIKNVSTPNEWNRI